MRGAGVGSSEEETNLRRSIVILHDLHTHVCTHKVRLWWFDTQLSFNRGLIFDWCIGENVGWMSDEFHWFHIVYEGLLFRLMNP